MLLTGCTREGVVDTDDCPETITVSSNSYTALTRTFICAYSKASEAADPADNGRIIGGLCASRVASVFSGKCQRVYIYEAPSDVNCPANAHPAQTPTLCACDTGFPYNEQTKKCEPN